MLPAASNRPASNGELSTWRSANGQGNVATHSTWKWSPEGAVATWDFIGYAVREAHDCTWMSSVLRIVAHDTVLVQRSVSPISSPDQTEGESCADIGKKPPKKAAETNAGDTPGA